MKLMLSLRSPDKRTESSANAESAACCRLMGGQGDDVSTSLLMNSFRGWDLELPRL
jgi:hypothetical protein